VGQGGICEGCFLMLPLKRLRTHQGFDMRRLSEKSLQVRQETQTAQ
jgi:hypothetical protein